MQFREQRFYCNNFHRSVLVLSLLYFIDIDWIEKNRNFNRIHCRLNDGEDFELLLA